MAPLGVSEITAVTSVQEQRRPCGVTGSVSLFQRVEGGSQHFTVGLGLFSGSGAGLQALR